MAGVKLMTPRSSKRNGRLHEVRPAGGGGAGKFGHHTNTTCIVLLQASVLLLSLLRIHVRLVRKLGLLDACYSSR